jgi:hypothetical protein
MEQKNLLAGSRETEPSSKKVHALGVPACAALEASFVAMLLSEESTKVSTQKEEEEERIEFYLKVSPKSLRKTTRVSTLDRLVNRKGGSLDKIKSSRSLQQYRSKSPTRAKGLVCRSLSTPCA